MPVSNLPSIVFFSPWKTDKKEEDRAIIVLLENRILERRVSDCMPSMMKIQTSNPSRTAERVKAFFEI